MAETQVLLYVATSHTYSGKNKISTVFFLVDLFTVEKNILLYVAFVTCLQWQKYKIPQYVAVSTCRKRNSTVCQSSILLTVAERQSPLHVAILTCLKWQKDKFCCSCNSNLLTAVETQVLLYVEPSHAYSGKNTNSAKYWNLTCLQWQKYKFHYTLHFNLRTLLTLKILLPYSD